MTRTGAYKVAEAKTLQPTSLGDRIRLVRTAWGWSQARLARELKVPQQSVSCWERGQHPPVGSALASLLRLFGMREQALIDGDGFQIPSLPDQVSAGLRITEGSAFGGDLSLPSGQPGRAWLLDLSDGEALEQANKEAIKHLKRALESGRSVWIMVR